MTETSFKTCSDCMNKQSYANLRNGSYYCPLVAHTIPGGIVHYDTDAIECIREDRFRSYPITFDNSKLIISNILNKF